MENPSARSQASGPPRSSRKARARSKSVAPQPSEDQCSEVQDEQVTAPATSTVLRRIPRPPNAFILYRSNKMREIKQQQEQADLCTGLAKLDYQRKLSSIIG